MKKLFTFIIAACVASVGYAQYWYVPYIDAGENPGGLNTTDEFPLGGGLSSVWSSILGPSTSATYSGPQSIPFSFSFNGNSVTQYKVSNTGIVTFDVGSVVLPVFGMQTLPSTSIPDNSVVITGIEGTDAASADNVVAQTFGNAPNRQHWVMFASYTISGVANSWTYWSVVFEETTNKIYIVDQRHNSTNAFVTAGIQINSSTAYTIGTGALAPNAGTDATPSDNTYYEFIQGTQPGNDLTVTDVSVNTIQVLSEAPYNITGTIFNRGANAVSSFDLHYTIDNGTAVTENVTMSIPTFGTYNFTHATQWTPAAIGNYTIEVSTSNPNGSADDDPTNDAMSKDVVVAETVPDRIVLIEEKTGTWCGWCPRGHVGMAHMWDNYQGSVAPVAVHNADPMVDATYDASIGSVAPGGYPGGVVDRIMPLDPNADDLEAAHTERMAIAPMVDVKVPEVSIDGNSMSVTVKAEFIGEFTGDYRINAIVTENHVTGTDAGYAQVNYYSNNIPLSGAGHNWFTAPDPVPASDMEYDHVGRELLGDFLGSAGTIPATTTAGMEYSKTYNYNIPTEENPDNYVVIAVVTDNSTNEVLNANYWSPWLGVDNSGQTKFNAEIFPNPFTDVTYLNLGLKEATEVQIKMIDVLGKVVYSSTPSVYQAGNNVIELNGNDLKSGVYYVTVNAEGTTLTKKVLLDK